nr:14491_t:CDS:10 [Entrophospora candida]
MAISQDSKNPPALPPRKSEFSGGKPQTPPAWLVSLTRHNQGEYNHPHEFLLSKRFNREDMTVFICKKCHKWFRLKADLPESLDLNNRLNPEPGSCIKNHENKLHHLHTTMSDDSRTLNAHCCLCSFVIKVDIDEPLIDIQIFDALQKSRQHYSTKTTENESQPDFNRTIVSLGQLLDNAINENMTPLPMGGIHGDFYKTNIGWDSASQALLEKIGYKKNNNQFEYAIFKGRKRIISQAKEELDMQHMEFTNFQKNDYLNPYDTLANILGTKYQRHNDPSQSTFNPVSITCSTQASGYSILGCVSDMEDDILKWAYHIGIYDFPEKTPQYLQAIHELSLERKSDSLSTLVGVEKSRDKFTVDDVKEAYLHLQKADHSVSDDILIDVYKSLMSDRPTMSTRHREALSFIGKFRNSSKILNFLKDGAISYGDMNVDNYSSDLPVGLDNIGNTCYLNSLLQYYFTIRDLRETVISFDSSDINGFDYNHKQIIIGGREVSNSEITRAKKFVNLLRNLFINLVHTQNKSISPEFDLAFMALVSAKNDEDEPKDPSPSLPSKPNIDELSSPPDSRMNIDYSNEVQSSDKVVTRAIPDLSEFGANSQGTMEETVTLANDNNDQTGQFFTDAENDLFSSGHDNGASKGKDRENYSNTNSLGQDMIPEFYNSSNGDKEKNNSGMLFGKQQDVTECMDNVMFQLEAAIKSTQNDNMENIVKSLFYGETRQVLHYTDQNTAEGRDLYDGLDVYFDTSTVDFEGTQAEREVTLTSIPPILQIHVQRVQFDRSTSNVYKSNAFLRFDKVIYLDRYLDKNGDLLRQRRLQANSWKMEIDRLQTTLKENYQDKTTMLNPSSLLRTTADFIKNMKSDYSEFLFDENADWQLSEMEQESIRVTNRISDAEDSITTLRHKLKQHYHDLKECEYHLHAVFIHSGQATFGHYWIYIYDIEKDRWLKYNDSYVTEVEEREVLADTTGSSANPYYAKNLVETVCRRTD